MDEIVHKIDELDILASNLIKVTCRIQGRIEGNKKEYFIKFDNKGFGEDRKYINSFINFFEKDFCQFNADNKTDTLANIMDKIGASNYKTPQDAYDVLCMAWKAWEKKDAESREEYLD